MPTCSRCGRNGLFLTVGKESGLCPNCLEEALDAATKIIEMIKHGGDEQKKALNMIGAVAADMMAEDASEALATSPFGIWDSSIHSTAEQYARVKRSKDVAILSYDSVAQTAIVQASGGGQYKTSFTECTCGDFRARRLPCKHMYRLAAIYGGVDFTKYI